MPPAGSRGRAPYQGVRGQIPHEAKTLLAFGCSMDTANLQSFIKFGLLEKSDSTVVFAKKEV